MYGHSNQDFRLQNPQTNHTHEVNLQSLLRKHSFTTHVMRTYPKTQGSSSFMTDKYGPQSADLKTGVEFGPVSVNPPETSREASSPCEERGIDIPPWRLQI